MQQKRAGPLFSRIGCLSVVGLVFVMAMIIRLRGGELFNPGSLSASNKGGQPVSGALSHAEIEQECGRCHIPWQGLSAGLCQSCHEDVADQRLSGAGLHGRLPDSGRCSQCHREHQGREAKVTQYDLSKFNHVLLTDFSLITHTEDFEGGSVACGDCHRDSRYERWQVTCLDCHRQSNSSFIDDHAILYGDECAACHDGQEITSAFDHQLIFTLDGGHVDIECSDCHRQPILFGTPDECYECHAEPDLHFGQFGLDCARCHSSSAWTPAHLSYHIFPLDHGRDDQSECSTCHLSNYQTYACYSCHEHEEEQVFAVHQNEGLTQFEDCAGCHPTGSEEDLAGDR